MLPRQPFLAFYVWGSHCRHLANMTELSMCGRDAALCQITLTICLPLWWAVICTWLFWKRLSKVTVQGCYHYEWTAVCRCHKAVFKMCTCDTDAGRVCAIGQQALYARAHTFHQLFWFICAVNFWIVEKIWKVNRKYKGGRTAAIILSKIWSHCKFSFAQAN